MPVSRETRSTGFNEKAGMFHVKHAGPPGREPGPSYFGAAFSRMPGIRFPYFIWSPSKVVAVSADAK